MYIQRHCKAVLWCRHACQVDCIMQCRLLLTVPHGFFFDSSAHALSCCSRATVAAGQYAGGAAGSMPIPCTVLFAQRCERQCFVSLAPLSVQCFHKASKLTHGAKHTQRHPQQESEQEMAYIQNCVLPLPVVLPQPWRTQAYCVHPHTAQQTYLHSTAPDVRPGRMSDTGELLLAFRSYPYGPHCCGCMCFIGCTGAIEGVGGPARAMARTPTCVCVHCGHPVRNRMLDEQRHTAWHGCTRS